MFYFYQELLFNQCRYLASIAWVPVYGHGPFLSLEETVLGNQPQWWTLPKAVKSPSILRAEMRLEKWEDKKSSYGHRDSCSSVTLLLSWMPGPRKPLAQVSLGPCLWGFGEDPGDRSPHGTVCGSSAAPLLGNLWAGSPSPWPSLSEVPRHPCNLSWEPCPPLGALAEVSEVSGIAAPGGAGYPILQHVTTIAEPTHAAFSPVPGPSCAHCCTHCSICARGCRASLHLGLSLVDARQKKRFTLSDQVSAGNKALFDQE